MPSKSTAAPSDGHSTRMTVALWILQALLALTFLLAGGMKLVLPIEALVEQIQLPGLLVRFIGVIDVICAVGLFVPGLVRIRPSVTALAAALLAIEMVVATLFSVAAIGAAAAVLPVVMAALSAVVAYGRWRLAPQHGSSRIAAF